MGTPPTEPIFPSKSFALSGKIMLIAITVLFAVMIFVVLLHLYARWYLRQRQTRHVITHRPRHVILHSPDRIPSPRGLDKSVLASLPIVEYAHEGAYSTFECAVCLSEFEIGEKVRFLPKCEHGFHIDCIDMWFHSHATCPVCRSIVEKMNSELVLPGLVESGSSSGLCGACHSNAIVGKISAEFGLPSQVESDSCATCHIGIRVPIVEQSADTESGSSIGSCATCQSTSIIEHRGWRNGRIRIEVPSRSELKSESGLSSPASQGFWTPGKRILSLNRIFSMGKKSADDSPVVGDGPSCDPDEMDLECGVN